MAYQGVKGIEGVEVGEWTKIYMFPNQNHFFIDARFLPYCYVYFAIDYSFTLVCLHSKVLKGEIQIIEFTGQIKGTSLSHCYKFSLDLASWRLNLSRNNKAVCRRALVTTGLSKDATKNHGVVTFHLKNFKFESSRIYNVLKPVHHILFYDVFARSYCLNLAMLFGKRMT